MVIINLLYRMERDWVEGRSVRVEMMIIFVAYLSYFRDSMMGLLENAKN